MKGMLIAALLGSTALTGAALAQEAAAPDATEPADTVVTTETVETAPAPTLEADGQAAMGDMAQGGFMTYQAQDQMIASNLMGANVRGAEDEVIGAVDDLLLDRDGRVLAVIVGVGGFLGIGERDVAISTDQLDFVLAQDAQADAGAAAGGDALPEGETAMGEAAADAGNAGGAVVEDAIEGDEVAGTAPAPGADEPILDPAAIPADGEGVSIPSGEVVQMDADGTSAGEMDATGGMTTADAGNARFGWTGEVIDHIRVNFTREQLEAAPAFETIE